MSNWTNIQANSNLVITDTGRAVLIKLPKSKFKFWHPKKLIRFSGKNGYLMSIGITPDFNVKLFRTGEGKHNFKEIIFEKNISGAELISMFDSEK